jgi:serine/threonine protein kinase
VKPVRVPDAQRTTSGDEVGPGDLIGGRYRVRRLIAQGAMGEVFEAGDDASAHQRVAIKLLRADFGEDAEWRARFKREVAIAATIKSPYVPRLLEAGKTQAGRRWIAFEYLDGESLDVRFERDGTVPFPEVAWMIEHALAALDAAHGVGVIHRDIKPANLLHVFAGPKVYVLDFGVAKQARLRTATSGLTCIDERLGTPSYASPEQLVNAKDVDARSDLYGVGVVTYRAITGRLPFDTCVTALGGARALPSLASSTGLSWPDAFEAWIAHMASPQPAERFHSAAAALEAWKHVTAAMQRHAHAPVERGYVHEDTDIAPLPEAPVTRGKPGPTH